MAAVGWLVVSLTAVPTPTPRPSLTAPLTATPAPERAPAVVVSPSATATTVPTPTPAPTSRPVPSPTVGAEPTAAVVPTSAGSEASSPAVVASPTDAADAAPSDEDVVEAPVDWQAYVPTDQADHLATMDRAARDSDCGVPWQLLAAIARVESDFGRNMATSSAGAIGYGQFLPSSWQSFGSEGNAYDYRDALPAIALYLCQSGLERDPRAALFAYNHADWYVDMVLDLAVRYDRMAPGAPTPDVLGVGPDAQQPASIHYANGRDARLQSRARTVEGDVRWLGVPWHGRTPGRPIGPAELESSSLTMVRADFALRGNATTQVAATSEDLAPLANVAWDNGLLGLPGKATTWSTAELRQHLQLSQPVVVFVGNRGLPGHPADEAGGEQPLVLIGSTPDGFIYNDPTFSSSLGYGLEISETDLLKYWDAAARPRQALAFVARPKVAAHHVAEAEAPEPIARMTATATPVPLPTPTDVTVTEATTVAVMEETTVIPTPSEAIQPNGVPAATAVQGQSRVEPSYGVLVASMVGSSYGVGALSVVGLGAIGGLAFALRRLRGGRRPQ
jgi:Transglycosylase SLT domain